jgi:hypothetical protein
LKAAGLGGDGARKGAFDMAEQLGFQQLLRQRGAID